LIKKEKKTLFETTRIHISLYYKGEGEQN